MCIEKAIEEAGSQAALARRLRMSVQRLANWRKRGFPAEHAIRVSKAVGWKVTPHELAPEMYPHPDDGLPHELRRCCQHDEEAAA